LENLILLFPTEEYREKANEFKKEFFDYKETVINGSALLDQLDYTQWLEHVEKYSKQETAGNDWVPSTTFFAVRKEDSEIIGIIDIRHHILHPFLTEYGGHIGYSVRPTERCKGYATEMLALALKYAKELGLQKVMLGCYADNIGSVKAIETYCEKPTEEKPYSDGKPMFIYWINL
jgi:predicted acetyltransferase